MLKLVILGTENCFGDIWETSFCASVVRRACRLHTCSDASLTELHCCSPKNAAVCIHQHTHLIRGCLTSSGLTLGTLASGSPGLWSCWSSLQLSSHTSPCYWYEQQFQITTVQTRQPFVELCCYLWPPAAFGCFYSACKSRLVTTLTRSLNTNRVVSSCL